MKMIYEPSGKAREYSALAMNVYSECDHGCTYCYVPSIIHRKMGTPTSRLQWNNRFRELDREASRVDKSKRILLSFLCDPYCHADVEIGDTRRVVEILKRHLCKVSILSKGGNRMLRDVDLFDDMPDIMLGATLVFDDPTNMAFYEPKAAPTRERMNVLKELHDRGFKTWASFEPVYSPQQSLKLMEDGLDYIDVFKVGKLNYNAQLEKKVDWELFGFETIKLLRANGKEFYIKNDLAAYLPPEAFRPEERNPDRW